MKKPIERNILFFFPFYIDHVTSLCFVIGKRANKKFQEPSAIDFWLLLFPTPSVSAILSPRIIRHRFDCTRTHTSFDKEGRLVYVSKVKRWGGDK